MHWSCATKPRGAWESRTKWHSFIGIPHTLPTPTFTPPLPHPPLYLNCFHFKDQNLRLGSLSMSIIGNVSSSLIFLSNISLPLLHVHCNTVKHSFYWSSCFTFGFTDGFSQLTMWPLLLQAPNKHLFLPHSTLDFYLTSSLLHKILF